MTLARRVLVTGANGFVGRRVCHELARQGHAVRCAVRAADRAGDLPGEIVAVGALAPTTDWSTALADVDAIVHLAARVHVMRETEPDALAAFRAVNVVVTRALASAAAAGGVRRFVYVSSIKVNGESTRGAPFTADDAPQPADAYGISKWEAECALREIASTTSLEVAVVRPPLVYGPGVGGNFLRLLKLVSAGIPLPLGATDNRRSMIYTGNLAHALIACALSPHAGGQTYLVSDGEDVSTTDLLRRLAAVLGKPARLWPMPGGILRLAGLLCGKKAEIDRLLRSLTVDSRPITVQLGWRPVCDVQHALAETAKWFVESRA